MGQIKDTSKWLLIKLSIVASVIEIVYLMIDEKTKVLLGAENRKLTLAILAVIAIGKIIRQLRSSRVPPVGVVRRKYVWRRAKWRK